MFSTKLIGTIQFQYVTMLLNRKCCQNVNFRIVIKYLTTIGKEKNKLLSNYFCVRSITNQLYMLLKGLDIS